MQPTNLLEAFTRIDDVLSPRIAACVNDTAVKLVRFVGEFVWHHHELEDELFHVVRGTLRIEFRDRTVTLNEGDFVVVPRGVEHKPVADDEVWLMLVEPVTTLNTGNVRNELTKDELRMIEPDSGC